MLIGFFIIYLIEELVHNYLHRHQRKLKKAKELEEEQFGDTFIRGLHARNSALGKTLPEIDDSLNATIPQEKHKSDPEANGNGHSHGHGHSHLPVPHSSEEDALVSSLRGLLIVLALSIHELFEGFAVGLEKTSAS